MVVLQVVVIRVVVIKVVAIEFLSLSVEGVHCLRRKWSLLLNAAQDDRRAALGNGTPAAGT